MQRPEVGEELALEGGAGRWKEGSRSVGGHAGPWGAMVSCGLTASSGNTRSAL